MANYKKTVDSLTQIYEANIFNLSLGSSGHYFARHHAVYNSPKYQNVVAWNVYIRYYARFDKMLQTFINNQESKTEYKGDKPKKKRKLLRYKFYIQNPKAMFYDRFLNGWFHLVKFGLLNKFSEELLKKAVSKLKKINFEKIYCTEEAIKYDSSYLFNAVLFLKHLNIDRTIAGKCEKMLEKMYLGSKANLDKLPKEEYQSFVYSLTHIIIADSKYYQRFVSGHQWIIKYFINNIQTIISRTTPDIVSEVGLCLRLCRQDKKYERLMSETKKQLVSKIKWNKLETDPEYLHKREHTNSILIMLLANNKKFYAPFKLSKHDIF